MTACMVFDDNIYGPDGEQKVKVSFVLALGSSDNNPLTKAETWSPDTPDGTVGYGPEKAIGDNFDNTILLNSLQIVFFTPEDNLFYSKVAVDSWEKMDPEEGEVSNLYKFTGHMWVDEEYVLDDSRKLKMMVFANVDEEVLFVTDIEDMVFKGVKKDRTLTVDNSKVLVWNNYSEESLNSCRIELYNTTNTSDNITMNNPPFTMDDLYFTSGIKVRFTVSGSEVQSGKSYNGRLLFADEEWWPQYNIDANSLVTDFVFTGDGTYEVEYNIGFSDYHENHKINGAVGASVFVIDIEDANLDNVFTESTSVTIDEVIMMDHQEYIPMWGVKTLSLSELSADAAEDERPVIYVLRAMAKVEVDLSDNLKSQGYTLSGVTMYNLNMMGYSLPNTALTQSKTEALDLSESFKVNSSYLDTYVVNKRVQITGESDDAYSDYQKEPISLYVPEYDNSSSPATLKVSLLHNESGVITQILPSQSIEFKTYTDGQPGGNTYNIYRNHNYRFVITGINPGGGLKYHLVKIEDLELGGRYGFEF